MFSHARKRSSPASVRKPRARLLAEELPSLFIQIPKNVPTPLRFAAFYPILKTSVLKLGDYGKVTLPQILGVNHWMVIIVFVLGGILMFRWFEKKGL